MSSKPMLKTGLSLVVGAALCVMAAIPASAAELPPGTIISKANLDKVMNDTFQGKTIKSMLIPSQEYQIRSWGLQMKLRKADIPKMSKGFVAATKRYSKDVKFDPKTREVSGYKAGLPFPDIDINDKYAGDKVIWNWYFAQMYGMVQYYPHSWLLVNPETGVERRQDWYWLRVFFKGRLENGGNNPVLGDGSVLSKTLFFVTAPYDLKGIGLFTIRYDSPKLEDTWVYVKSVRRTRRLSGSAWVDPVDGLDMLADEIGIINARPSWYKSWKVLSKKTILVVANARFNWVKGAPTLEQEFPLVDLKNWPHWNPSTLTEWEPREVWEVEGIPPSFHPHSKRIIYMDTQYPAAYIGEGYDRENKLWKYVQYMGTPITKANEKQHRAGNVIAGPDDDLAMSMCVPSIGVYIDFKRRHASVHYARQYNGSLDLGPNDVTLGHLEAA
ncbi:MAG: DUF1329 domain-containing protein, partial [Geobacteraceae bacterium]